MRARRSIFATRGLRVALVDAPTSRPRRRVATYLNFKRATVRARARARATLSCPLSPAARGGDLRWHSRARARCCTRARKRYRRAGGITAAEKHHHSFAVDSHAPRSTGWKSLRDPRRSSPRLLRASSRWCAAAAAAARATAAPSRLARGETRPKTRAANVAGARRAPRAQVPARAQPHLTICADRGADQLVDRAAAAVRPPRLRDLAARSCRCSSRPPPRDLFGDAANVADQCGCKNASLLMLLLLVLQKFYDSLSGFTCPPSHINQRWWSARAAMSPQLDSNLKYAL